MSRKARDAKGNHGRPKFSRCLVGGEMPTLASRRPQALEQFSGRYGSSSPWRHGARTRKLPDGEIGRRTSAQATSDRAGRRIAW